MRIKLLNKFLSPVAFTLLLSSMLMYTGNSAVAATRVFVQNNTSFELSVDSIDVTGGSLSKKAWKRGEATIAKGNREHVLSVNRTGKFNWMDPTPRFIEPGKTVVFSVSLKVSDDGAGKPISLRLKLLGTGSTSKMWYMLSGTDQTFEWEFEPKQFKGQWKTSSDDTIDFSYRAYEEGDDTHVEYVFLQVG